MSAPEFVLPSSAELALPTWARPLLPVALVAAAAGGAVLWGFALSRPQPDYVVYVFGARALLHGRPLYAGLAPGTRLAFTYPPAAAALFAALAPLPLETGQLVWAAISLAALVVCASESLAYAAPWLPARRRYLLAGALIGPVLLLEPVRHTLVLGQVNVLLAAAVLADLRRGRWRFSGVLIGLAGAVKLTPLIFLAGCAVTGRPRTAVRGGATFLAVSGAMAALAPGTSHAYWLHRIFQAGRIGGLGYVSNQSVLGVATRLLAGPPPAAEYLPVAAGVLVLGLMQARAVWRRGDRLLADVVVAATGLLVSPVSWSHHFVVWLLPFLAWLWFTERAPRSGRVIAVVLAALFWAAPLWWVPDHHNHEYGWNVWQSLAGDSFFVAAAVAVVFARVAVRRQCTRPPAEPCQPPTGGWHSPAAVSVGPPVQTRTHVRYGPVAGSREAGRGPAG